MKLKADDLKRTIIKFISVQTHKPFDDECENCLFDFYNWVKEEERKKDNLPSY